MASRVDDQSERETPVARGAAGRPRVVRWALAACAALLLSSCWWDDSHASHSRFPPETSHERTIELVPRIPYLAMYPCTEQCHDSLEPDRSRRALTTFHSGRRLEHGPAILWCDRCHAIGNTDRLLLFDGRTVSFDEADRVCAQCHGEKHRDWSVGMHGLQTGGWMGNIRRRSCPACHDPHMPDRFHVEALPPPIVRGQTDGAHP